VLILTPPCALEVPCITARRSCQCARCADREGSSASFRQRRVVVLRIVVFAGVPQRLLRLAVAAAQREHGFHAFEVDLGPRRKSPRISPEYRTAPAAWCRRASSP